MALGSHTHSRCVLFRRKRYNHFISPSPLSYHHLTEYTLHVRAYTRTTKTPWNTPAGMIMSMVWEFVDSTDNVKYIMLAYYLPIPSHPLVCAVAKLRTATKRTSVHPWERERECWCFALNGFACRLVCVCVIAPWTKPCGAAHQTYGQELKKRIYMGIGRFSGCCLEYFSNTWMKWHKICLCVPI